MQQENSLAPGQQVDIHFFGHCKPDLNARMSGLVILRLMPFQTLNLSGLHDIQVKYLTLKLSYDRLQDLLLAGMTRCQE